MKKIALVLMINLMALTGAMAESTQSLAVINAETNVEEMLLETTDKQVALSCTCYGGPGNYRYSCPPVAKTCYGGPGNYPYTCYVCPN